MPANIEMLIVQGKKKLVNDQSKSLNSWCDLFLLLNYTLLQKEFSEKNQRELKVSSSLQGFPAHLLVLQSGLRLSQ